MLLFEIILAGFDGGTDETDNHILWVTAESISDVHKIAGSQHKVVFLNTKKIPKSDIDYRLPDDAEKLRARIVAHEAQERINHLASEEPIAEVKLSLAEGGIVTVQVNEFTFTVLDGVITCKKGTRVFAREPFATNPIIIAAGV